LAHCRDLTYQFLSCFPESRKAQCGGRSRKGSTDFPAKPNKHAVNSLESCPPCPPSLATLETLPSFFVSFRLSRVRKASVLRFKPSEPLSAVMTFPTLQIALVGLPVRLRGPFPPVFHSPVSVHVSPCPPFLLRVPNYCIYCLDIKILSLDIKIIFPYYTLFFIRWTYGHGGQVL